MKGLAIAAAAAALVGAVLASCDAAPPGRGPDFAAATYEHLSGKRLRALRPEAVALAAGALAEINRFSLETLAQVLRGVREGVSDCAATGREVGALLDRSAREARAKADELRAAAAGLSELEWQGVSDKLSTSVPAEQERLKAQLALDRPFLDKFHDNCPRESERLSRAMRRFLEVMQRVPGGTGGI
jgi:hypothetical protein